jgi:predicted nucleic acid-binding protein
VRARRFADTNVLVYLFDADAPAKRERAREILATDGVEGRLVISTQVLQELFVTVTRKLAVPLPPAEALAALDSLDELPVTAVDRPLVRAAAELSIRHRISLWDALIVEAARAGGCQVLLTEDLQDGWEVAGLRVENPFRDS